MEVSETNSSVPGYLIYKHVWDAVIVKELRCERESDTNRSDQYAVTVKRWNDYQSPAV